MRKFQKMILGSSLLALSLMTTPVRADLFGGDVAVLAKILVETIKQVRELQKQSDLLEDELRGVNDRIRRLAAIKELIQGTSSEEWRNPAKAVRRLSDIYYTLPPELRTKKADAVELELRRAVDLATRITNSAGDAHKTGSDLEQDALSKSPGVAQKLTASGVGSLIELSAQNQVAQGTIISLLTQMVAESGDRNAREISGRSSAYGDMSRTLPTSNGFSSKLHPPGVRR